MRTAILSFLLFWINLSGILSQEISNFHFRKIQVDQGLSENTIYCIVQDAKGFLWFGTKDGLNRYDGSNFRIFRHDSKKPKSLPNNFIRSLCIGDKDILYVGTDAGIFIMNTIEETFEPLNMYTRSEKIVSGINSLLIDRHGSLWIGTMNEGVFVYDIKNQSLRSVNVLQYDLGVNAVWCVYEDKSGIIWLGTRLGLLRYNPNLKLFEAVTNLFNIEHDPRNEILTIQEDTSGSLWLGTWAGGIRHFDKYTSNFVSYLDSPLSEYYVTHIRSLYQYDEQTLMIGADDGLYLFNTSNNQCQRVDKPRTGYSLSDQNIYSIAEDKEGGIWLGTYFGGINYLNKSQLTTESYYPDNKSNSLFGKAVSQFCEDDKGNLWIATEDGGVNYFDTKTKKFSQPIKTSYHNTHALLLDGENLWIGTFSRGIDIYNTKTGKITNYRNNQKMVNSLNDDCVFSIFKTNDGDIYVGTPLGLNKFNRAENNFSRIPQVQGFIYDVKEDKYGNLWVANYGLGITKYDNTKKEWISYNNLPDSNPIVNSKLTGIHIDKQGQLWFSSEGRGIFLYNYESDTFRNISETDGLPNNVVYGILDDDLGNIWLSCNKGLVCFKYGEKINFKLYDKDDGLQSNQFNYKSYFKAKNGKFYFGGINGFNSFYPQDLIKYKNENIPPVEITDLKVLGNYSEELRNQIQISINKKENIVLNYNNSSFTISYVGLSFISQTKNQYAYMLVGVDKDWIHVGNNQSVTYVNLTPGKYIFKVKASNNSGKWNENGAQISIEILPPFWLSLPAKLLYILLILIFTYLTIQYYWRRNQEKQKHYLESYKAEQENLAFKSKIDFFTTIAHEVRTPLSLIKAPLEEIRSGEMDKDDMNQNFAVIEKNCERLTVLINQLLDFRKMDSTTYVVNPEKIDIKNFLQEIYDRFKKTAQSRKLNFELILPENLNPIVVTDTDALTKIVGNLLTNAMKFTTNKIILKLEVDLDSCFTLSVEDNGRGIANDKKELIFDPFYQIQKDDSQIGTGIGLSLVKHLSGILNGKISVEDSENGGAKFLFKFKNLEIASNPEKEKSQEQNHEIKDSKDTSINKKDSVLLVEDNIDMVDFIARSLRNEYSVESVNNASQALKLLEERSFDLIISDIMMPDIDGITFVRKVKNDQNLSHIPIILLSAKTENSVKVEGLRSGADVFVEKPFSTLYLKAQINSLLENRKAILETFNRSPLASYSILTTNKSDEEFLNKLNNEIEKHLSDINFSIESMTDVLGMSRSNLQRKLKGICGVTPGDYLRTYRLKRSCKFLLETDMRINEVAYEVGFSSPSYFTKCFLKQYNVLPKEFVRKNQE